MQDLAQELQQKNAELAALREIGQAINASWDLKATLDLITRRTAEVMGTDSCSIYLLEDGGSSLVLKATTGLARQAVGRARLRLGEGLTGWAARTGQAVGVADASQDPRFKLLPETQESIFQSLAVAPLVHQGRVIGAINVQTRSRHEYATDQIELLSLIADLAAGALEKATLYDRMQQRISELSTLAEVSRTVTSPLYPDEMLELIVEMATRVMHSKVCSIMLLDEERNELVPRAIRGPNPVYREQAPIRVGEGIAGMVAQSGEPVAVADVRLDPRYRYRDIARQEGFCSLLCVPLRVRERTIGVLNCYTGEPHTFSEQEVSLFTTLANQTALALENARLATSAAVVREMHHRIKNNLQSVIMLLRLQMTEGGELSARDVLHEAINRIQSIATVHEVLSHRGLQAVEVRDLLKRVVESVARNMASPQLQLAMQVEGEAFSLPSQPATSLALVINELTQNAVEHAFVGRERGSIHIVLGREGDNWLITVRDNGVGLPERPLPQLGLQIVETLVREDLHGSIQFARDEGTIATIRIPRPNGGSSQGTPWARQQEEEHAYTHRR